MKDEQNNDHVPQQLGGEKKFNSPQNSENSGQQFDAMQSDRTVPYAFNANAKDTRSMNNGGAGTAAAAPRNKKKGLIISLIAVALVLLGAGLAYVYWYQNPKKVVSDAIMHAITAKTMSYKGTVTAVGSTKMVVTINGDANNDGGTLNAKFVFDVDDEKYTLDGNAVLDAKNDLYFKVQNVDSLVNNYRRAVPAESQMLFDQIIDKVDDKWVKVSSEDLKSFDVDLAKTQECSNEAARKIQNDAATKSELTNTYKKHPFIAIDKNLGAKDGSLGYTLSSNQETAKAFVKEYKNSSLYKDLVKCDSSYAVDDDEIVNKIDNASDSKTNVDLWVNQWTHHITKVAVKSENDDKQTFNFAIEPLFNRPVTITTPKESTTIEQLQKDVMELLQSAQSAPTTTPATEA